MDSVVFQKASFAQQPWEPGKMPQRWVHQWMHQEEGKV
jgi:hypothetical protein